jgi:hypothetical protein
LENAVPSTAQEVYSQIIQALSPAERLRLATLILNELVQQNLPIVESAVQPDAIDQQDNWTEQDQADIVRFSLQYAAAQFTDDQAI